MLNHYNYDPLAKVKKKFNEYTMKFEIYQDKDRVMGEQE